MWDLRKPTLVRWWEDTEQLQDESNLTNTLGESTSARQAVGRWLIDYKKYSTENVDHIITTKDTGASKDKETYVRKGDIDKEYGVKKKDGIDRSNKIVRNSIIKKKDCNIANEENNDRDDIKRNNGNRNDRNINDRNRNNRNRNDRNRNDRNRNDRNNKNKKANICPCKCNKRRRQMRVKVSKKKINP